MRRLRGSEQFTSKQRISGTLAAIASTLTWCGAASAQNEGAGGGLRDSATISAEGRTNPDAAKKPWLDLNLLDLNIYGISHHPDRDTAHRLHVDNEINPGLGVHYEFANDQLGATFAEVGSYRDSGRNWAKFASLGYQFKIGERLKIGGALAAMNSKTYNNGATFVGMFPLITYDFGSVKLNAVYFPKFGNYNHVDAFGVYVSIPFGRLLR